MPSRTAIALLSAILLTTVGCASSPTITIRSDPDVDFTRYATFGFFDTLGTDRAGYRSLISESLRTATTREMEARGFTYEAKSPDLRINFSASLDTRWRVTQTPVTVWHGGYYGYRTGLYRSYYQPEVREYPEGTLNVDVVDVRAARLIWEGIAVGRPAKADQSELQRKLAKTVADLFERFPMPNRHATDA